MDNNLISFDKLGDVVNNLIDKLSSAVGWISTHDTPNRIAINTYIEGIKNSNYDPLTKAALISQAKRTIKEYCNQSSIVKIATEFMSNSAKPKEIDDDWLAQFMDKARLVSDEEFHYIWGRILAEECNNPHSMPKSLLHILEQMDSNDAKNFSSICSVSIYINENKSEFHPIVIHHQLEEYETFGITYNTLVNIQALGLIEMDMGVFASGYMVVCETKPLVIHYNEENYELQNNTDNLRVGNVIFTKTGKALCKAVAIEKQEDFFEKHCIPFWEESAKAKETVKNQ